MTPRLVPVNTTSVRPSWLRAIRPQARPFGISSFSAGTDDQPRWFAGTGQRRSPDRLLVIRPPPGRNTTPSLVPTGSRSISSPFLPSQIRTPLFVAAANRPLSELKVMLQVPPGPLWLASVRHSRLGTTSQSPSSRLFRRYARELPSGLK